MNENFHCLPPPVDSVVKPLSLSPSLMQAGKSSIFQKVSKKPLFNTAEIEDTPKFQTPSKSIRYHVTLPEKCNENYKELSFLKKPKIDTNFLLPPMAMPSVSSRTPNSRSFVGNSPCPARLTPDLNLSHLSSPRRKTVVVDLDETLVHSSATIPNPDHVLTKTMPDGSSVSIRVSIRPYAKEFIRILSSIADVVIFTAGMKNYADQVLTLIDPNNEYIKERYYRENCVSCPGGFIKDLKILNKNLKDVLIVDNLALSFNYQQNNGILINSWYGDKNDSELSQLLKFLKKILLFDDLRKCDKNFHIKYM